MHLRAPPGTTSGAALLRRMHCGRCVRNETGVDSRTQTQDSPLPFPSASVCVSHVFSVQLLGQWTKPLAAGRVRGGGIAIGMARSLKLIGGLGRGRHLWSRMAHQFTKT